MHLRPCGEPQRASRTAGAAESPISQQVRTITSPLAGRALAEALLSSLFRYAENGADGRPGIVGSASGSDRLVQLGGISITPLGT